FTDWTFFNTGGSVATGTLNGISVSLTGGNLWGVTDGSSSVFSNAAVFSPALVATDYIELIGAFPTTPSYGVTFGSPVTNPIVLVQSLASRLHFSGITLTKVSGEPEFVVAGSDVTGEFQNVNPC